MSLVLAPNAGFCYGVKRAVELALETQEKYNKMVYTLGPLIHNNDVVDLLKSKNIFSIELDNIDSLKEGDVIIIRSHGISLETLNLLQRKGLTIIDATCPHVSNIQKKVKKYSDLGYSIVIVGDKNHPEVIGINGWCNNKAFISKEGSDFKNIPNKVCVVSQTTEKQSNWERVLNSVIKRSKEIVAFNTICNATEVRQKSADELSKKVDLMVVIGGKHSSNTTKLYEICKKNCPITMHIENSNELPNKKYNFQNIGVTAGASTPDWIIKEAILKMNNDNDLEMNEQLQYMEKNSGQLSIGSIVTGEITSIDSNDREAFVNIGYKSDALLPIKEITKKENAKISEILSVDQKITGKIISLGNESKPPVISVIELNREEYHKEIQDAFENGKTLVIKLTEVVNGGIVGFYKETVRVFVPASHLELHHINNLTEYLNLELEVNIIEYKTGRRSTKIIASRRNLLKIEKEKAEAETWQALEKDTIVEGEVKRLTDFGAFIDVNGVDGLLHVSEISWGRINRPSDELKIGDKIKVYILDINKESKKLSLSIKKLIENPWENVDIKYPVGTIVLGKVVRFASFGAFVELEPGVDALVHISQISHKRINKADDVLTIGEEIKAKIIDVDKENKKIGLSIREASEI